MMMSRRNETALLLSFLVLLVALSCCHAFVVSPTKGHTTAMRSSSTAASSDSDTRTDVVVFGVGDLRTDDHVGLVKALQQNEEEHVLPVVVLDETTLQNIPGATVHTVDTANLLHHALQDLETSLQQQYGLQLQVLDSYHEIEKLVPSSDVHIHVCDLGPADTSMGYSPYSYFQRTADESEDASMIHPWTCRLRHDPWQSLHELPDDHPTYAQRHAQQEPQRPMTATPVKEEPVNGGKSSSSVPSVQEIVAKMSSSKTDEHYENTGLYGTHWGGLDPNTIGESRVLEFVNKYARDCNEDDEEWMQSNSAPTVSRNSKSLEHAAMEWMSNGGTKNWIAGEPMTRFLAAPLFFGTISPRRLWHASQKQDILHTSPLQTLAESREWHSLLAARNLHTDPQYTSDAKLQYKYWRWHGFLCRYAHYEGDKDDSSNNKNEGMLLIHGFGASGSQWAGTISELPEQAGSILAPDLVGFGQSEKPPLTYTQYLWESYASTFCKEVASHWDSFVVGGNSIGGYTSMGVAADDTALPSQVSASGAPGSQRCAGVVLMNSAGQLKEREDIDNENHVTIAQTTCTNALPKCSPIPRPAARFFGNGLLWYLRPRIQSICKNLYPTNPNAVSNELCQGILRDSLDPGANNVMISGSKLPPPRTANELLGANYASSRDEKEGMWKGPVLVAQGMLDPLNDAKTRASMFSELREGIDVTPINAGHCPHDELPGDVANAIAEWMQTTLKQEKTNVDTSVASKV